MAKVEAIDRVAANPRHKLELIGIVCSIALPAILLLLPTPQGLSPEGHRTAAIFLVALSLWLTEAIPIAATALLVVILQPLFRVATLPAAFTAFISPAFFFVLSMFIIALAVTKTGLANRFALSLLSNAGTDSRRVVLVFMSGTAAISTVISDVPCCAIFMSVALGLFKKMDLRAGESQFAKAVMIGIPVASLIGGVGTPAGSAVNIVALSFIEQYGNVRVPFVHWMALGIPLVVILIPLASWILTWFFKPEFTTIGGIHEIRAERDRLGSITAKEWKVILIMGAMIVLWVLSSWISGIEVVLVAMAGAIVMFFPGIRLFTWKEAEQATGWQGLLLCGGIFSLGAASANTGLAKFLVNASIGGIQDWSALSIVGLITAFTVVVHLMIPNNTVITAVLIAPLALLATAAGQNPALYTLPVAFTASCAFLLPLDTVPLLTYGTGYYRMLDMLLPGLLISICWVILMTALVLIVGPFIGLL